MRQLTFRKNLNFLILAFSVMCLSGCIYLVIGSVGALGGYIVSPDTVEGITDRSPSEVWDTAVEIISIMGVIDEKNKEESILLARVNGTKVTVTVLSLSEHSVKLSVKARKAFLPKIKVAQDVYVKIMSNLKE